MSAVTTTGTSGNLAATAAATFAASGQNGKAKRPVIQTSMSGAYPSELRTPLSAAPANLKRHDSFKSPVSPPSSYRDFLNKVQSPGGLMSPPNTSGSLSRFPSMDSASSASFDSQTGEEEHDSTKDDSTTPTNAHPPITRNASTDSSTSSWTVSSSSTDSTPPGSAAAGSSRRKPQSPRIMIPNNHTRIARPHSARTPHGLRIPHSPFTPSTMRSPMSARSVQSPYTTSAHPNTPWSAASFSPRMPFSPRNVQLPSIAKDKMSVPAGWTCRERTTVTTTYESIYDMRPLDPAPRGKRRKTVSSEEPPQITPTQERHDAAEKRSKSEEMVKEEDEHTTEEEETKDED
ncbi:ATP-dependent RNA helicase has1 [Sphaceloma murrayae]|uniref:ATP-dependent RNA helicase has1 n=1 Tax=Sphaceloma murrayae TaxID=2082308 RepID=A0A2K1QZP5_9PEZI|nr:ATP-dependent RNA helicase has1 [Sphaceloma murrayae]